MPHGPSRVLPNPFGIPDILSMGSRAAQQLPPTLGWASAHCHLGGQTDMPWGQQRVT